MGTLPWSDVAAIVAMVSLIWHIAMYVGIVINKVKRVEDRTDDHDQKFERVMDEIHEIKRANR